MKKRRLLRFAVALAMVAGVGVTVVSAEAAGEDALGDKIERERKALEKIQGRIQEKEKKAQEAEKKRESVLQAIQSLDQRLVRYRQEHHAINRQLKKKDREIEEMSGRLATLQSGIQARQDAISARLRVQYMEGRFGNLKTLLASRSYSDFQSRFQYLSAVSQREYEIMAAYRKDATQIQTVERQREEARNGMLAVRESTEQKLAQIRSLKKKKRVFLTRITQQKESYERAVEELRRSAARVDSLLNELEERRRAAAARPSTRPAGIRAVKGALPWPTDGTVVSYFGRQKHPTFDTFIQRKGIEIRVAEGSMIRAVMEGTVAYADWLKGYGLVLILDHGNGFFSLYAHASKILASVGERVEAAQTIGETGDTGMTGEDTLYFELREGADAVDPLLWLVKR